MTHHRRLFLFVLFAALCLVTSAAGCFGASGGKVVLVLADYLSIKDITSDAPPTVAGMVRKGGVALLIPSAVSARNPEASYATASAGANCWGSPSVDSAFNAEENVSGEDARAGVVYERRLGKPSDAAIVHLELFKLRDANAVKGASSLPGALGDELKRAGKRIAVFGNSDTRENLRRRAAVIGASSAGQIPMGDLSSSLLKRDPTSPAGFVTDSELLARKVDDALQSADLVIVDFGDTDRADLLRERLSDEAYQKHHRLALANLDAFLSRMLKGRASDATVVLASMIAPVDRDGERRQLGPIIVRRPNGEDGVLISATTRTAGLVSAVDFAPTVLRLLGVGVPKGMIGGEILTTAGKPEQVTRLSNLVVLDRRIIVWVLAMIGGLGILAVTLGAVAVAFGRVATYGGLLRVLFVLASSSPLAVLFATSGEPLLIPFVTRVVLWALGLTVGAFVIAGAIARVARERVSLLPGGLPVLVLMVATCLAILVDAFVGGEYSRFTVISAGRFDGYRFYGIGNEYMGVWLGMALTAFVWIGECFPRWSECRLGRAIAALVGAVIIVALGFPRFGANAGGAIAAVVGFGLVYRAGVAKSFTKLQAVGLVAAGFVLVALIGVGDVVLSKEAPSHIGRAAAISGTGLYSYLTTIAIRKVGMNIALIGTPQAKFALLGSIPFFALWFWKIREKFDGMAAGRPALRVGAAAVLVAAAVAFLFNDSGIVAWGLIVAYLSMTVIYSLIDRERAACIG